MLGAGNSWAKLEWTYDDDTTKQVELAEFIELILVAYVLRFNESLHILLFPSLSSVQLTNADRKFFKNSAVLRNHIRQVIIDR